MSSVVIPEWLEKKEECDVCHKITGLTVSTKKGVFYLCSDQCQLNFNLQTGMTNVNQMRHKDGYKVQSVGKLDQLSAEEIKRLLGFAKRHDRETMNKLKKGDSLDRILGIMLSNTKRSKVKKV